MDKSVNRVTFSAIISATGEQVNDLQRTHYSLHVVDALTPNGARLVPKVEPVKPIQEIQDYYADYVWPEQGDGK